LVVDVLCRIETAPSATVRTTLKNPIGVERYTRCGFAA
jgi:hypothetical protein